MNWGFLGDHGTLFRADGLAILMSMVSSFVGSIIVFYSWGYISHYKNQNEYYLMVVLFLAAMMGLVFTTNLVFLFIFWEITSICSWRLIGFFREKDIVLKADKAFLVTVFGALVMLIGFIMVFQQYGTFDITKIPHGSVISDVAMLLILFGIFSKSATLPFHTWLPDAGVAPSPVTSLLHAAVLVKIGVYVYARLFVVTFNVAPVWALVVPIVAGVSALVLRRCCGFRDRFEENHSILNCQPAWIYFSRAFDRKSSCLCRRTHIHIDARSGKGRFVPLRRYC